MKKTICTLALALSFAIINNAKAQEVIEVDCDTYVLSDEMVVIVENYIKELGEINKSNETEEEKQTQKHDLELTRDAMIEDAAKKANFCTEETETEQIVE